MPCPEVHLEDPLEQYRQITAPPRTFEFPPMPPKNVEKPLGPARRPSQAAMYEILISFTRLQEYQPTGKGVLCRKVTVTVPTVAPRSTGQDKKGIKTNPVPSNNERRLLQPGQQHLVAIVVVCPIIGVSVGRRRCCSRHA